MRSNDFYIRFSADRNALGARALSICWLNPDGNYFSVGLSWCELMLTLESIHHVKHCNSCTILLIKFKATNNHHKDEHARVYLLLKWIFKHKRCCYFIWRDMHNDQDWKLVIFRSCIGSFGHFGQVCDGQHLYALWKSWFFFHKTTSYCVPQLVKSICVCADYESHMLASGLPDSCYYHVIITWIHFLF